VCNLCEVKSIHWDCRSCGLGFCESCFDKHFLYGQHVAVAKGQPTEWRFMPDDSWPWRRSESYRSDGTGRQVWIPVTEPSKIEHWNRQFEGMKFFGF